MAATLAKALYSYESTERGDLNFYKGEVIEVLNQNGEWWEGKTRDGRTGYFPFNRVEIIPGGRAGRAESSLVNSVKIRRANEKVVKVSVDLKELKKSRRGQAVFNVKVNLESGEQIVREKQMSDFRRLDNALQSLDPRFEYVQVLPPNWADEIPLSSSQAKQRARSLTKYLAHNINGREVFDMLILKWVQSDKTDLKNRNGSNRVQLTPSDSKERVQEKIMSALVNTYRQKSPDPMSFFSGGKSLVQVRYKWDQRDDTEISLSQWEYVLVLRETTQYDGWWYGQRTKGEKGLFPSNYVKRVEPPELRKLFKNRATQNGKSPGASSYHKQGSRDSPSGISRSPSRVGRATDKLMGASPLGSAYQTDLGGRDRKLESGFCVKSVEAYEELTKNGVTMEINGRPIKMKRKPPNGPKRGDFVKVHFNAYVWDPQSQTLREFSSSDKLKAPPKGVSSGAAGASGFKMEFVVGRNEVIDGLEDAVGMCEMGKPCRAVIAPSKGYGDVGSPPEIPGNCYLVYDLNLEKISKNTPIDRRQIFSVGISKPNVELRPQQRAREYQGLKSMGERQRRRRERGRTQNR